MSNSTFAPSAPICGEWRAGKSCTWTGAEITAQGMPWRLATCRSIWVPSTRSGRSGGDARLDLQVVVGDQRLDAVPARRLAHLAGEFAAVGAEADHVEAQLVARHPRGGDAWVASPKTKTRLPVR